MKWSNSIVSDRKAPFKYLSAIEQSSHKITCYINLPTTSKMAQLDKSLPNKPVSQKITRDGKTVKVNIISDGEEGWLLEVVDQQVKNQ